ncbi:hypothetical protein B0T18DRAFT_387873 [Schizothecium vesticola]|uniref:Amidohydrolase-related domain-containing protein n=1 Tax=Schizothecium vesticola TaxID=314040 RepID=A0AA40F5Y5_9PEZI|nr:hypothetical protein B0T18DRAFT_387873 [Schizothecium vesticola]
MPDTTFTVHTSLSFDPRQKKFVENVSLKIDGATGTITDVYHRSPDSDECLVAKDGIDLRAKVVLPGLVDSHTHIFLHSYRERSGTEQMRDESAVERVVRACDAADGVDGERAAVRRRVGEGADLIKFYADYRRKVMRFPPTGPRQVRFPPERRNTAVPLYAQDEMDAIVEEAGRAEIPMAAHAGETRAALMAVRAGVTTVEHIFEDTDGIAETLFKEMRERGTIWVLTLVAAELMVDADIFAAQKVMILMEADLPVEEVLAAATIGGWEACGGDRCGFRFGWFEKGNRADVVALDADPRVDKRALRKVSFVMKDGETWKRDGRAVTNMVIRVPDWPDGEESSPSPRSSDDWTELSDAQPPMVVSVPSGVCTSPKLFT